MNRPGHGVVQIGVRENDVRTLPSQLEGEALQGVGRRFLDDLGRLDVPGEWQEIEGGERVEAELAARRQLHGVVEERFESTAHV